MTRLLFVAAILLHMAVAFFAIVYLGGDVADEECVGCALERGQE